MPLRLTALAAPPSYGYSRTAGPRAGRDVNESGGKRRPMPPPLGSGRPAVRGYRGEEQALDLDEMGLGESTAVLLRPSEGPSHVFNTAAVYCF